MPPGRIAIVVAVVVAAGCAHGTRTENRLPARDDLMAAGWQKMDADEYRAAEPLFRTTTRLYPESAEARSAWIAAVLAMGTRPRQRQQVGDFWTPGELRRIEHPAAPTPHEAP